MAKTIEINETNFPDENFRRYVKVRFDIDNDGALSAEEIAKVTRINVKNSDITSLKGIEYFTALKELDCSGNHLTELDVSNNTALEQLWCDENELTSLDVSNCIVLKRLQCHYNPLTSLDVSNNPELMLLYCRNDKTMNLYISNNQPEIIGNVLPIKKDIELASPEFDNEVMMKKVDHEHDEDLDL